MRRVSPRPISPRSGLVSSASLLLAVGIAMMVESQPLARTPPLGTTGTEAARSAPAAPAPGGDRSLERIGAVPADNPSALSLPGWKPGFEWHYRWSDQRGSGTYIRTIAGMETVDGVPCYVMRTGNREILWRASDLAWVMERVGGRIESRAVPEYRRFLWPLEPGKTWIARYQWEHPAADRTEDRVRRHRVAGAEPIQVPAGTYEALRVVVTDTAGKKVGEYWYAPEARWLVKERLHTPGGIRDRELIYAALWPKAPPR